MNPNYSPRWPLGAYSPFGLPVTVQALPDDSGITAPTISVPTASNTLSGATYLESSASAPFLYTKAAVANVSGHAQRVNNNINVTPSIFEVSWMFDGTEIEVGFQNGFNGVASVYLVNGTQVGSVQAAGTYTTNSVQLLTFAARGPKKITLRAGGIQGSAGTFGFSGVVCQNATDTVWAPPQPQTLRCIVLGDSYTSPLLTDTNSSLNLAWNGWSDWLGRLLGWDVWPCGEGGTGYITVGNESGAQTYPARFATYVTPYNPDILIIAGGYNDRPGYITSPSSFTAALATMTPLVAATTARLVIVIGPWRSVAYPSSDVYLNDIAAALSAWASANSTAQVPWMYIENQYFIQGTGYQTGTTGVGNSDYYIGTDQIHLTAAGAEYMGRQIAAAILQQLV